MDYMEIIKEGLENADASKITSALKKAGNGNMADGIINIKDRAYAEGNIDGFFAGKDEGKVEGFVIAALFVAGAAVVYGIGKKIYHKHISDPAKDMAHQIKAKNAAAAMDFCKELENDTDNIEIVDAE